MVFFLCSMEEQYGLLTKFSYYHDGQRSRSNSRNSRRKELSTGEYLAFGEQGGSRVSGELSGVVASSTDSLVHRTPGLPKSSLDPCKQRSTTVRMLSLLPSKPPVRAPPG